MIDIYIPSLEALPAAAGQLLAAVGEARVLAFYGAMGAGKTTLIRELCAQLGVTATVTSPTFAIVNEYRDDVFHFDFYRIRRLEEAFDIGFQDYLDSGAWCLIEWPELVEPLLPDECVRLLLTEEADGCRRLCTVAAGAGL